MVAQKGADFLLNIAEGGGVGVPGPVGGFRSNSMTMNNETIDITNKDSNGKRELIAGGIQSFSASGSGVFVDDAAFALAHTAMLDQTADVWDVVIPDFGTHSGPFMITSLEMGGEHNGEVTYSISLESAGALTFTAA